MCCPKCKLFGYFKVPFLKINNTLEFFKSKPILTTSFQVEGTSLADKAGLRNGDLVDELQFERNPAYERLHELMESARHELNIIVLRLSFCGVYRKTSDRAPPGELVEK